MAGKKVIGILFILCTGILVSCTFLRSDEINISPDDIVTPKEISFNQKEFVASILPHIWDINDVILEDRKALERIKKKLDNRNRLRRRHIKKLNALLDKYRLSVISTEHSQDTSIISSEIDSLLLRVNTIPVKLVLAQAIIESGWGTSRFASEGNNLFGIRCYTPGCGMQPDGMENNNFWVRSYPSYRASVKDYIMLLNTGYAFKEFRTKRQEIWENNKKPSALQLSGTLSKYSERRNAYLDLLSAVILEYTPENIDELREQAI